MKLYVSPRAPNPRRVLMFIAEKGIAGIAEVVVEDPAIRQAARESFRFYREQGYPLQDHRLQRL